jgi:MFS family permease
MTSYDLTCTDPYIIGLFGGIFFLGFALFSPILPSLSDEYGRKWLFTGCLAINAIVYTIILIIPGGINPAQTLEEKAHNLS